IQLEMYRLREMDPGLRRGDAADGTGPLDKARYPRRAQEKSPGVSTGAFRKDRDWEETIPEAERFGRGLEIHAAHAAHAATTRHGRGFGLGGFHDRGFGGDQQRSDRGGVFERGAHDLDR